MADILVSVTAGSGGGGMPPPYGADRYVIFGKYRGGWDDSLHREIEGTSTVFNGRKDGEHQFWAKGQHEILLSQEFATDTIVISGTGSSDPVPNGTPMPDGTADVIGPGGCEATLNA